MKLNEMLVFISDCNKNVTQQPISIIPFYSMVCDYKFLQYRFPKSKKRRIRKKWSKKKTNYKHIEQPHLAIIYGKIYANKPAYNLLKKHFETAINLSKFIYPI